MNLVEQIIARRPDLRLLTATNGLLGIELARKELPAVILMDINLPGISGVAAMEILRRRPSHGHIPVIALSANANPRDIESAWPRASFAISPNPSRSKNSPTR
jgi:CheY-like chemotaxis protein